MNGQARYTVAQGASRVQRKRGVRTRVLLVAAMALVIVSITLASLLLVRRQLGVQIAENLSADLEHSVLTFQNLQTLRLKALERENALLSDLPSLKALMTTSDPRTIEDGGVQYWKVSGNDLFALSDNEGHLVAAYSDLPHSDTALRADLKGFVADPTLHYLVTEGHLYACSIQPLYFGSEARGTLLGFVISGFAIERDMVRDISQATTVETVFVSKGHALASTLSPPISDELTSQSFFDSPGASARVALNLGGERYLAATQDLSSSASAPLQLVVLKSFAPAEKSIQRIDRLVLISGVFALILGTVLMLALSRAVTKPLEELASGVRAFGVGDSVHELPDRGAMEVLELSLAFARMRDEIKQANRALLESERLATIGRMAGSVSHDLRHYLSAVYANAEFLASATLSEADRSEILSDIRLAVHGTTELIESMLIFGRTGGGIRRSHVLMSTLLERGIALVRIHPDGAAVTLAAKYGDPAGTVALLDEKQIERAIYNLLLNACQAVRDASLTPCVLATLEVVGKEIVLKVVDNGTGVPENIRKSLFQPFVSEGKQKGTGLGLTLAHCIAVEHGGEVVLVNSEPGQTTFRMTVQHGVQREELPVGKEMKGVVTE